jgi:iron complex transport system permease protein
MAYQTVGSASHQFIIPAASLYAVIFLLGGQLILERVFNFNSSLSVMVEFAGGLLFIFLLLKGSSK